MMLPARCKHHRLPNPNGLPLQCMHAAVQERSQPPQHCGHTWFGLHSKASFRFGPEKCVSYLRRHHPLVSPSRAHKPCTQQVTAKREEKEKVEQLWVENLKKSFRKCDGESCEEDRYVCCTRRAPAGRGPTCVAHICGSPPSIACWVCLRQCILLPWCSSFQLFFFSFWLVCVTSS